MSLKSSNDLNWSKSTFIKVYKNVRICWEILKIESYLFYISEKMKASLQKVNIDQIQILESVSKPQKISENIEHKKPLSLLFLKNENQL